MNHKDPNVYLSILQRLNVVLTDGHFILTSGKHSSVYVHKDALYPHTEAVSTLCSALAEQFVNDNVETVIGPTMGGIVLAQWTANHLSELCGREVYAVYAEKSASDARVITRGFGDYIVGKRVLVVEDILTTGGTAKKVADAVRSIGGTVVGLGAICNRGNVTPHDVGDVPKMHALTSIQLNAWNESERPLCTDGVPINTEAGHGREYLMNKNK